MTRFTVALLVLGLHAPLSAGLLRKSTFPEAMNCPMDYNVPLPNGKASDMHLASVANFLKPKVQDRWWDLPHIKAYYHPTGSWHIGPSKIAGCGIIASHAIKAGERIGMVWMKDPAAASNPFGELWPRHFTPWYGRGVNHCNKPNTRLQEDDKGSVFSVAIRDIAEGEEVTGDYNEAARQFPALVQPAPPEWTC